MSHEDEVTCSNCCGGSCVRRRFSAAGFGELLATYLHFADELLGQPAPKLSHAPRSDAMAKLRSTESRDGFHFQIEALQSKCDNLQTQLSLHLAARDHLKSQAERLDTKGPDDGAREALFLLVLLSSKTTSH
jgi:hypothetical protein